MLARKRGIAIGLLAALLLPLCGCSGEAEPESAVIQATVEVETGLTARSRTVYPFPAGVQLRCVARAGGTLMIAGSGEEGASLCLSEYRVDETGVSLEGFRQLAPIEPSGPETAEVYGLNAAADGGFLLLTGERPPTRLNTSTYTMEEDNPDFTGSYRLFRFAESGELQESWELQALFASGQTLRGILPSENDFVLYGPSGWLRMSQAGAMIGRSELENIQISVMQMCDAGLVALGYDYSPDHNGACALRIDGNDGFERLDFPVLNRSLCQDAGGELLYNEGTGIFAWDIPGATQTELLKWSEADKINGLCRLDECAFACLGGSSDSLLLLWGEQTDGMEQNVVHVLLAEGNADMARELVKKNESGSSYRYEYTTADLSREEERTRLLAEIAAGNGPDLILFSADGVDGSALDTGSSVFADLYPFIDADETLSREAFLPGLLPALESRGELHEIWLQTMIVTLAIRDFDLEGESGADPAALSRRYRESGYLCMVDSQNAESMLRYLAEACAGQFVDPETGDCRFDDPAFAALLAWCAELPRGEAPTGAPEECMLSIEQVNLVRFLHVESAYMKAPFTYIGFPTGDGKGHFYSSSGPSCVRAAIPANSQNAEGAWAFLSAQLSVEKQLANAQPYYDLPVVMEALERAARGPVGFEAEYLTEEQLTALWVLVHHTDKALTAADEQLTEIVVNEGLAYLAGDRSLEETVALIQSRANLYLSERFG